MKIFKISRLFGAGALLLAAFVLWQAPARGTGRAVVRSAVRPAARSLPAFSIGPAAPLAVRQLPPAPATSSVSITPIAGNFTPEDPDPQLKWKWIAD